MQEITPQELQQSLQEQDFLLVDVREPWEFETAQIAGFQLMPLGSLPQRFRELDPDRRIALLCHHGVRSAHAAAFLERMGYTQVYNITGGIDAWSRTIDPDIPVY